MARFPRVTIPGAAHHVTQRGVRRYATFLDNHDRENFLDGLRRLGKRFEIKVWGYCLMTNHVHMVLVPSSQSGLSVFMRSLQSTYAAEFNRRHGFVGHLWENRFFSSAMDEFHTVEAIRYDELNPVRAGMVKVATDYRWSSARGNCRIDQDPILSADSPLNAFKPGFWADALGEIDMRPSEKTLLEQTLSGRPCGSEEFVDGLEKKLGVCLKPTKAGRPVGSARHDGLRAGELSTDAVW